MLKYFLKNPRQTGAIANCSKEVAQRITSGINLENAKTIIELGAGVGALTQSILQKKSQEAILIALEINAHCCARLQKKFPSLEIENQSATKLLEILQTRQIVSVDAIISALPWTCFKETEQNALLENIYHSLSNGGYFATVVYPSPLHTRLKKFRKKLFQYFGNLKTSPIIWGNIPPACVYYCKRGGGDK